MTTTQGGTHRAGAQPEFSPRQREVLDLLARGRTNPEIAGELGISLDGAKWHVSEVMSILGVSSREEAARWWRERQRPTARLARLFVALRAGPVLAGIAAVVAAGALVVLVVAVAGFTRDEEPASPTETPTPTPPPTMTASPATSRTVPGAGTPWPAGTSTGDAALDAVIDAVLDRDDARVQALIRTADVPCGPVLYPQAEPIVPECPSGTPEGTPITALPLVSCSPQWSRPNSAWTDSVFNRGPQLYAVYRQSAANPAPPALPAGEYVVLFTVTQLGRGFALHVDAGQIVLADFLCGPFPNLLTDGVPASDFVLEPPGGIPAPIPVEVPRLTGNPEIDPIIIALVTNSYAALAGRVQLFPEPCAADPQGVGSPPRCPDGVPDGGSVQTARVATCERAYLGDSPGQWEGLLRPSFAFPHNVYAVFPSQPPQYFTDWLPAGEVTVVISGDSGNSAWRLDNGRIVGVELGCGFAADYYTAGVPAADFILPPLP
ncbi:MAG: helix-turn-helix transcriptional regulator [Dehalococcoidia bacterium]|nr:helix-turn-helix transcriptional regulator [Dehalococcoidia bacterium]